MVSVLFALRQPLGSSSTPALGAVASTNWTSPKSPLRPSLPTEHGARVSRTAPLQDSCTATRDTTGHVANFIIPRILSGIAWEIVFSHKAKGRSKW